MRPWRIVIVGYGQLGAYLARWLAREPWSRIVGVVDPRAEARERAADELGLARGALHRDLGAARCALEADVALINTPSELHAAQARAALRAGWHALVAKPLAHRFSEAVRLVALARARGRTLAVGQQLRFNRHYRAVRAFIESGRLGRVEVVHFLNSKPRPDPLNLGTLAQPALLEMSCHHFDSLFALLPEAVPETIVADGFRPSWSAYGGPCTVNALIRLSGGVHVLYHCGFSAQADCYELRLEGTRGVLRCRGVHMSVDAMGYEFAPRSGAFAPEPVEAGLPAENPWRLFFALWRSYLEGGPEPPFSARRNLPVLALLSAAIESVRSGRTVRIAGSARYRAAFARSNACRAR